MPLRDKDPRVRASTGGLSRKATGHKRRGLPVPAAVALATDGRRRHWGPVPPLQAAAVIARCCRRSSSLMSVRPSPAARPRAMRGQRLPLVGAAVGGLGGGGGAHTVPPSQSMSTRDATGHAYPNIVIIPSAKGEKCHEEGRRHRYRHRLWSSVASKRAPSGVEWCFVRLLQRGSQE